MVSVENDSPSKGKKDDPLSVIDKGIPACVCTSMHTVAVSIRSNIITGSDNL